jgi:hypothetical protein
VPKRIAMNRRRLLQGLLAGGAVGAGGLAAGLGSGLVPVARADEDGPRFLIIMGCFGGASMIDSLMPVAAADAAVVEGRGRVISHDVVQPEGSNIRCVNRSAPVDFLRKHAQHAVVMGTQSSSVNHFVAQARWVNGRDVHRGRTMAEMVASAYGSEMALPNVNMGRGGYAAQGTDPALDPRYRAEIVTNPVTFPLSTHGWKGVLPLGETPAQDPAVMGRIMDRTRAFRDTELEALSPFSKTFVNSRRRRDLLVQRHGSDVQLELDNLVEELFFVPDLGDVLPLSEYGLTPSTESDAILDLLNRAFPANTSGTPRDRLDAQAALAYLLIRTGASCAVTLTEPGTDGFLAFDQSHQNHARAQRDHWDRVLTVTDKLIRLLQSAEYVGPSGPTGTSLWDRSMIVFATEFGRDKWDTGSGFGTGHHLNNGLLVVSPMLAGDQSLGDPDPDNGFICGFDADTGEPTPFSGLEPGEDPLFSDERMPPTEERVFGGLLDVLGVEFEGQETLAVLKR